MCVANLVLFVRLFNYRSQSLIVNAVLSKSVCLDHS